MKAYRIVLLNGEHEVRKKIKEVGLPSLANSTANKQFSKCCFYCNHQICTDILVHADGLLAICTLVAPLGTQVRRHQTTLF
ncbi:hypothetical protein L1887_37868 [Cichorium endivia]|nr:hypothetical protein L1887_37868 [Cichorium endivia]